MLYQPMLEVMRYLRDNGYRTYIVTGGGQDFVRVYASRCTASRRSRLSDLRRETLQLRQGRQGDPDKRTQGFAKDNDAGKPEDIYLFIGRRLRRSAIRPATGRCWNTPRRAAVQG